MTAVLLLAEAEQRYADIVAALDYNDDETRSFGNRLLDLVRATADRDIAVLRDAYDGTRWPSLPLQDAAQDASDSLRRAHKTLGLGT